MVVSHYPGTKGRMHFTQAVKLEIEIIRSHLNNKHNQCLIW